MFRIAMTMIMSVSLVLLCACPGSKDTVFQKKKGHYSFTYEIFDTTNVPDFLSNEITAVAGTTDRLWIGSAQGLNMFDGTHWHKIDHMGIVDGVDLRAHKAITKLKAFEQGVWIASKTINEFGVSLLGNDGSTFVRTYLGANPHEVSALSIIKDKLFFGTSHGAITRVNADGATKSADLGWTVNLAAYIGGLSLGLRDGLEVSSRSECWAGRHVFEDGLKSTLPATVGNMICLAIGEVGNRGIWLVSDQSNFKNDQIYVAEVDPTNPTKSGGIAMRDDSGPKIFFMGVSFNGIATDQKTAAWISSSDSGLYLYESDGSFHIFSQAKPLADFTDSADYRYGASGQLPSDKLTSVALVKPNQILIGTKDKGAVLLTITHTKE